MSVTWNKALRSTVASSMSRRGIVEDFQQGDHVADLRGLEVPGGCVATHGDAGQPEDLDVVVGLLGQRPHEDDDVAILHVAGLAAAFVLDLELGLAGLGPHDLADAPGDQGRLTLPGVDQGQVLGLRTVVAALV